MPLIEKSSYPGPPFWQINGHFQTIAPALRPFKVPYLRERLELPDQDFLDLDWLLKGSSNLLILSHGLEGSSTRPYMSRMASFFAEQSWDVLAWNCRSCSGEMNRNFRLYHHGDIEDLGAIVNHVVHRHKYQRIVLLGFSMGGAMSLKYLGVMADKIVPTVQAAIAFSTPCDLGASAAALEYPANRLYKNRFLKSLSKKMLDLDRRFPGRLPIQKLNQVKAWKDFDNWFTTVLTGCATAEDFYQMGSAQNFMAKSTRPCLVVNAVNDPILPEACSPVGLCEKHPLLFLERPKTGGHVGFSIWTRKYSWMEQRAWDFIKQLN